MRLLAGVLFATLVLAGAASAFTPTQLGKCLDATGKSAISTKKVIDGLSLEPSVVKEVRSRLVQYDSVRGFPGLDGIEGLTPEMQAEIMRRLAIADKARTWGIGNPCPKIQNKTKLTAFLRQVLIDNGYRKAPLTFTMASPRQMRFEGVQDGFERFGYVVRRDVSHIVVRVYGRGDSAGVQSTLKTPFAP